MKFRHIPSPGRIDLMHASFGGMDMRPDVDDLIFGDCEEHISER